MLYEHDFIYRMEEPKEPVDWLDPIFFLFHDNGGNENEIIERMEPYIHPYFRIISVRAPFEISKDKYAWTITDDLSIIDRDYFMTMAQRYHKFISFTFNNYCQSLSDLVNYSEGWAGAISLADKLNNGAICQHLVLVGTPYIDSILPINEIAKSYYDSIFVAHGIHDGIVTVDHSRNIWDRINELELKPDLHYHEYNMGHTPNEECLNDIKKYIGRPRRVVVD